MFPNSSKPGIHCTDTPRPSAWRDVGYAGTSAAAVTLAERVPSPAGWSSRSTLQLAPGASTAPVQSVAMTLTSAADGPMSEIPVTFAAVAARFVSTRFWVGEALPTGTSPKSRSLRSGTSPGAGNACPERTALSGWAGPLITRALVCAPAAVGANRTSTTHVAPTGSVAPGHRWRRIWKSPGVCSEMVPIATGTAPGLLTTTTASRLLPTAVSSNAIGFGVTRSTGEATPTPCNTIGVGGATLSDDTENVESRGPTPAGLNMTSTCTL